jgi:hypothetical protein
MADFLPKRTTYFFQSPRWFGIVQQSRETPNEACHDVSKNETNQADIPELSGIRNLSACWFKFLYIIILLHFMKQYYETEFPLYLLPADVYRKSSFMPAL